MFAVCTGGNNTLAAACVEIMRKCHLYDREELYAGVEMLVIRTTCRMAMLRSNAQQYGLATGFARLG